MAHPRSQRPGSSVGWLPRLRQRCRARWYGARRVVEWHELDVNDCLTTTTLLQQNWTPALIRKLLGRPDYAVLDLQGIREPLRFYDRNRVAQVAA